MTDWNIKSHPENSGLNLREVSNLLQQTVDPQEYFVQNEVLTHLLCCLLRDPDQAI